MAQIIQKTTVSTSEFMPEWLGSPPDGNHSLPGGIMLDETLFLAEDAVVVTVGAAGALADATEVPVDALTGAIPAGTLLDFGSNKFARLATAAAADDVTLDVDAIPTALVDNDTATYAGTKRLIVPSGTVIGRTFAERDTADKFGPAAAADDEVFIVLHDVDFDLHGGEAAVLFHGIVYENNLPGWDDLAAAVQALVRDRFTTSIAQD
jgi:hypothetical protein